MANFSYGFMPQVERVARAPKEAPPILPIYTLDIETDPFREGRFPLPFAIGFYDGLTSTKFWGDSSIDKMRAYVETRQSGIIYAHNGGRFDVYYIMDWIIGNPMRVINSRIIDARMDTPVGCHSFRDSYAIMPFALGSYKGKKKKLDIEIWKLENYVCCEIATRKETTVRLLYKEEIEEYLGMDCELLWDLCSAFHGKFGDKLTIGSTAMKELSKIHSFKKLSPSWDGFIRGGRMPKPDERQIRPGYYYGGRVECFEMGHVEGNFKVYDVNSMYPYVMKSMQHPIGTITSVGKKITDKTCFIKVEGRNYGAFPIRDRKGLNFSVKYGTFHVTIHEYKTALRLGIFQPTKILLTIDCDEQGTFAEFVDKFYTARQDAKALDDAINEMFYKLILNSAYGKFSQNPERYEDNMICRGGFHNCPGERCTCRKDECECDGWQVKEMSTLFQEESKNYWVWRCNSKDFSRFNVATGASITGASRSLLMEAIHKSKRAVYTDTDCVICESLPLMELDGKKLGAWKEEAVGTSIAIGGKKLYALFDNNAARNEKRELAAAISGKKIEYAGKLQCVKKANKGVVVTAKQILDVANGETVVSQRDAPSFSLAGNYNFIRRRVRMTA